MNSSSSPRLRLVPMEDVVPVPVEWLWNARLPRGKLAVVAGDPGLGKSYLTLKMAAIISTGSEWPDGSRATAAEVLIVSAEDDASDTIRPRLDRLGADVSRITMIDGVDSDDAEFPRPFSLNSPIAQNIETCGARTGPPWTARAEPARPLEANTWRVPRLSSALSGDKTAWLDERHPRHHARSASATRCSTRAAGSSTRRAPRASPCACSAAWPCASTAAALELCERDYSDLDMVAPPRQARRLVALFAGFGYAENYDVSTATANAELQFVRPCAARRRAGAAPPTPTTTSTSSSTPSAWITTSLSPGASRSSPTPSRSPTCCSPSCRSSGSTRRTCATSSPCSATSRWARRTRPGLINSRYIGELCADDWGLFYDVATNLHARRRTRRRVRLERRAGGARA